LFTLSRKPLIGSTERPRKDVSVGSATYVRGVSPSLCVANFRNSLAPCWLSLRAPWSARDAWRRLSRWKQAPGACVRSI